MHIPVLLEEILEGLASCNLTTFIDGTLGLGGHAEAILQAHPEIELYIGLDKDKKALQEAEKRLKKWKNKIDFFQGSFLNMEEILKKKKIKAVTGVLFDFGVSSLQLDDFSRGFSFRGDGPLDMRMDTSNEVTAEEVVNKFSEKKLGEIFRDLGDERQWKKIARAIVRARGKKKITSTKELKEIVEGVCYSRSKKHLHPATLTFQALRIFVNQELEEVRKGVLLASKLLEKKGKLGAISFHSGEDRIVKNTFKEIAKDKTFTILTKKPIVPSLKEMRKNPRSRSAKLRWLQKEV